MSRSSPETERLILAILEEELYLGRHHPTDYHPAIMGAKEAAKKIADLSCGAESNRHSGAVGTEKRAEQSNPGGGHEVTEHDAQKPYEQKAAGMTPRPAASTRGFAQTPADTYRETVRKVAATREKRRAELQEAVVAAHAAFEAIPIGFPLQQNGRTIDHTLLNEAKRLCELALSDTSTLGNSK